MSDYLCTNCGTDTLNMRGFNQHMRRCPECAAALDKWWQDPDDEYDDTPLSPAGATPRMTFVQDPAPVEVVKPTPDEKPRVPYTTMFPLGPNV